jgi:hypothetical protein
VCHRRPDTFELCCDICTINGNLDLRDLKLSQRRWLFKSSGIWCRADLKIVADVSEARAASVFILRLPRWWRQKAAPRRRLLYRSSRRHFSEDLYLNVGLLYRIVTEWTSMLFYVSVYCYSKNVHIISVFSSCLYCPSFISFYLQVICHSTSENVQDTSLFYSPFINVSDILLFLPERLYFTLPVQYNVLPTCRCICSCSYIESTGPLMWIHCAAYDVDGRSCHPADYRVTWGQYIPFH